MVVRVAALRWRDEPHAPRRLIAAGVRHGPLRSTPGGERGQRDHHQAPPSLGEEAARGIAQRLVADDGDRGLDVTRLVGVERAAPRALGERRAFS